MGAHTSTGLVVIVGHEQLILQRRVLGRDLHRSEEESPELTLESSSSRSLRKGGASGDI